MYGNILKQEQSINKPINKLNIIIYIIHGLIFYIYMIIKIGLLTHI